MHAGNYIVTIEQGVAQFIEAKWPDEDDELKYLVDKGISQFDETIISLDRFIQYVEDKKENVEENEYGNGKRTDCRPARIGLDPCPGKMQTTVRLW